MTVATTGTVNAEKVVSIFTGIIYKILSNTMMDIQLSIITINHTIFYVGSLHGITTNRP